MFSHVPFRCILERGVFDSEMDTTMDGVRENEKARVKTAEEQRVNIFIR